MALATFKAYITTKKDFDLLKRKGSWASSTLFKTNSILDRDRIHVHGSHSPGQGK